MHFYTNLSTDYHSMFYLPETLPAGCLYLFLCSYFHAMVMISDGVSSRLRSALKNDSSGT